VTFTGGDPCCSYGYYIDIDHGNGVMTRYGHLVQLSSLRAGQFVRLGDFIGYSGSTGYSTGPHLHFEIRLNGRPVDPLLVLP
jgi:murein DD-endopeptidase MepM/ murein hydrolase activator NlpD